MSCSCSNGSTPSLRGSRPTGQMATDEWHVDPTLISLQESAWRGDDLPTPFCTEVGRRMLLAELEFSHWVLRRVEKVQFERDRSVSRRLSIDLSVRDDAPVFVDGEGKRYWLVPLSIMRRRTLVNLDLRDEDKRSMTMLGLRMTQKLDAAMLRAAAMAAREDGCTVEPDVLDEFVTRLVAGDHAAVDEQMRRVESAKGDPYDPLHSLVRDPLFRAVLARLRRGFSLYAMLAVKDGRHRLIRMAFDEPTDWRYQKPELLPRPNGSYEYHDRTLVVRGEQRSARPRRTGFLALFSDPVERAEWRAELGLAPTRVRFQVPSAENAASYHFEVTAPLGVRIVQATLLAGRPNQHEKRVSADQVTGHSTIVGLHAVEIPFGSLCQAQVDLRVPARGWLTTLTVSCFAVFLLLLSVLFHLPPGTTRSETWVTNVVVLLITLSAGAATFVGQRDAGGVAARMVTKLRAAGVVSLALPAIGAAVLVYNSAAPGEDFAAVAVGSVPGLGGSDADETQLAFGVLTMVALLVFLLVATVWSLSFREGRQEAVTSPWDMTDEAEKPPPDDFHRTVARLKFHSAAVVVDSAEDWRQTYSWSDHHQKHAKAALLALRFPARETARAEPKSAVLCRCEGACQAVDPPRPRPEREHEHTGPQPRASLTSPDAIQLPRP